MNTNVQDILKHELNLRKKLNSKYSMRAFARDLQVSPGFLSEVLNDEKKLSVESGIKISKTLGFGSQDAHRFINLVRLQLAQSEVEKNYIKKDLVKISTDRKKFEKFRSDQFVAISDWFHFAILELMDVKDFKSDSAWIAKRLKISAKEATDAINRLIRLQMIEVDEKGNYRKSVNNGIKDFPSEAVRTYHKQHLRNIFKRIDVIPFEKRHITGLTVAVNPDKLPQAYELINDFRSQLCAVLEEGSKENVYQLAIQLFPLDTEDLK